MRKLVSSTCSALLLLALGCGPERVDDAAPPDVVVSALKGTVKVPAGFTGTPTRLAITGYLSVPPVVHPDAMFALVPEPVIGVGQDYSFDITDIADAGRYHVMAALYVVGGGTASPKAGVDYVGWTSESFPLEGGVYDVGEIRLSLFQPSAP